jgi:hypothetical protein
MDDSFAEVGTQSESLHIEGFWKDKAEFGTVVVESLSHRAQWAV